MRMKEIIRNTFRKKYLAIVLGAFLLLPLFIQSGTRQAFGLTSNLFSGAKEFELTHPMPNVLIFYQSSHHFRNAKNIWFTTYGEGTNPFEMGGSRQYYYGMDSSVLMPGALDNDDVSVEMNFHPLLRYIPDELLPDSDSSNHDYNYAYDVVSCDSYEGWDYSVDTGAFIPATNPDPNQPTEWKFTGPPLNILYGKINGAWDKIKVNKPYDPLNPATPGFRPALKENFRWVDWTGRDSICMQEKKIRTEKKKYKYPNDSFAYMIKNFFYRFLGEDEILKNVRLGLATNFQVPNVSNAKSIIYRLDTVDQIVSWTDDKNPSIFRGMLQENFDSGKLHQERIRKWFDGTEIHNTDAQLANPELRMSFWANQGMLGALYDHDTFSCRGFFTEGITDWCQDNYLILFYDGSYLNYDDPTDNPIADRVGKLYSDLNIKTFVFGLETYIHPNNPPAKVAARRAMFDAAAIAGGTEHAYYPDTLPEFLTAMREIFAKINETAATGSAPLVSPPRTAGDETRAYSAGFTTKAYTQWPGYLYSYTVSDDVVNWEAGAKLDVQSADSRNIYTADWDDGDVAVAVANLKHFKSDQAEKLRPFLAPLDESILSPEKLVDFIEWTRGKDVWGENQAAKKEGPERWKLGDPYHVGLVNVGEPGSLLTDGAYLDFAADNKTRMKRIYLHANDGMVHAFDRDTGVEKWAFIPPNVLGYNRLLGTKYNPAYGWVNENWASYAQYLLDGPLVAEDIFTDGKYRTVLLGSLGRGGAGLYALDVTAPDKPEFLWALENNYYHEDQTTINARKPVDQTFLTWEGKSAGSSSSLTLAASQNAPSLPVKLRLTLSTPFIGWIQTDTVDKWVALLGAGAQKPPLDSTIDGEPQGDNGGKAFYLLDMADGKMIKELTHGDLGMAVSPVSVEAAKDYLHLKKFYSGDDLGAVYEGDISSINQDDWVLNKIYSSGNVSGIPYAIEIGSFKRNKWLYWGTGNPDDIFAGQTGDNYFTALNRSVVGPDPATRNDLYEIDPASGESTFDESSGKKGWYFPFSEHEIITTPSVLYKGHLFFATYIPAFKTVNGVETLDLCDVGNSWIYIVNGLTGLGGWKPEGVTSKRIELKATRISGISVTGGKVYMGVTRYLGAGAIPDAMANVILKNNMLIFDVPEGIEEIVNPGLGDTARPTYWRDWKP